MFTRSRRRRQKKRCALCTSFLAFLSPLGTLNAPMCGRLRDLLSGAIARYGAAYFISSHLLGILMFWAVYAWLSLTGFDISPYLRSAAWLRALGVTDEALAVVEAGGTLAAAYCLSRLLSPVRIALVLLTLPRTAPMLNAGWAWAKAAAGRHCRRGGAATAAAATDASASTNVQSDASAAGSNSATADGKEE